MYVKVFTYDKDSKDCYYYIYLFYSSQLFLVLLLLRTPESTH